jgi:hypothetical protein
MVVSPIPVGWEAQPTGLEFCTFVLYLEPGVPYSLELRTEAIHRMHLIKIYWILLKVRGWGWQNIA